MLGPNITSEAGYISAADYIAGTNLVRNNALSWMNFNSHRANVSVGIDPKYSSVDLRLDLSKGNSLYGKSSTVQPLSINLNVLIKF